MERRWIIAALHEQDDACIPWAELCGLPCIANLLRRKGFTCADDVQGYLQPRLRSLGDPFLLPQMRAAVERILAAIDRRERIVLFGDYDVDGVTSLALLDEMLRAYGVAPDLFLPLRMEEGYGLSNESVERCTRQCAPQLLIAVDCGTSSVAEIGTLTDRGVDVIVLDHHEPKSALPECVAVVNPKISEECALRYLCSAGVVFKLCHALLKTRAVVGFDLKSHLDLVALGTVADIVPLEGENRALVDDVRAVADAQRLANGQRRPHLRLLQHDADALAELGPRVRGIEAEDIHVAAVPSAIPLQDLDRRRLPRAVRPQQAEDLALVDVEGDPAKRLVFAVRLTQVANRDRAHRSMICAPAGGNAGSSPPRSAAVTRLQSG